MNNRLNLHEKTWRELHGGRDRMPHALLFAGQAGIGKQEFAEALAASLLCESPTESGEACGNCAGCRWHAQGNHPDFRRLQPAAEQAANAPAPGAEAPGDTRKEAGSREITIDQVRALDEFMQVGTHRNGHRVVLITPAEAMNRATANALLKTLEEPPPLTVFLLVSDAPDRLLATIRSRCRIVRMQRPESALALRWLHERDCPSPELWLALAGGAPCLAEELARGECRELLDCVEKALALGPRLAVGSVAAEIDRILRADRRRTRLAQVVDWTQRWCHDLALAAIDRDACYFRRRQDRISALAREATAAKLFAFSRKAVEFRRLADHTLNARLFLEDLLSDYAAVFSEPITDPRP